jgi:MarR family transcriptional regulator for hemolysin
VRKVSNRQPSRHRSNLSIVERPGERRSCDLRLHYDLEESVGYWLCGTAKRIRREMQRELAAVGVFRQQAAVLYWIRALGQPSQRQLAKKLGIAGPSMTAVLDRMESSRLICRTRSGKDLRAKSIEMTEAGRRILTESDKILMSVETRVTRGLSDRRIAELRELLAKVCLNLSAPGEHHIFTDAVPAV